MHVNIPPEVYNAIACLNSACVSVLRTTEVQEALAALLERGKTTVHSNKHSIVLSDEGRTKRHRLGTGYRRVTPTSDNLDAHAISPAPDAQTGHETTQHGRDAVHYDPIPTPTASSSENLTCVTSPRKISKARVAVNELSQTIRTNYKPILKELRGIKNNIQAAFRNVDFDVVINFLSCSPVLETNTCRLLYLRCERWAALDDKHSKSRYVRTHYPGQAHDRITPAIRRGSAFHFFEQKMPGLSVIASYHYRSQKLSHRDQESFVDLILQEPLVNQLLDEVHKESWKIYCQMAATFYSTHRQEATDTWVPDEFASDHIDQREASAARGLYSAGTVNCHNHEETILSANCSPFNIDNFAVDCVTLAASGSCVFDPNGNLIYSDDNSNNNASNRHRDSPRSLTVDCSYPNVDEFTACFAPVATDELYLSRVTDPSKSLSAGADDFYPIVDAYTVPYIASEAYLRVDNHVNGYLRFC